MVQVNEGSDPQKFPKAVSFATLLPFDVQTSKTREESENYRNILGLIFNDRSTLNDVKSP